MITDLRMAEALQIQKMHGADAALWIAERLGALVLTGDGAGVERFQAIAAKLEELLVAQRAAS